MTVDAASSQSGPQGIVPRAVPFHSEECEQAILASFLLYPGKISQYSATLQVEHFYSAKHRHIYQAMLDLEEVGTPIDMRTIQAKLEDCGRLCEIGGLAYLAELDLALPDGSRLGSYVEIVQNRSQRRRLAWLLRNAQKDLLKEGSVDVVAGRLNDSLQKLSLEKPGHEKRGYRSVREILEDPTVLDPPKVVLPRLAWRGRTTLLASREKAGKSTLTSYGACCITEKRHFLGETCGEGSVLWVGLEEHESDLAKRLVQFALDVDRFFVCHDFKKSFAELGKYVAETKPVLIVVDTLAAMVEGWVDDPHKSTAWTPVMQGLNRIARESDAGMVLIHHARKSDGAYRDSTAIGAGVDVIFEMRPDDKDPNLRHLKGKGRFPVPDSTVRFDGDEFELCQVGPEFLSTRILTFVEKTPGASKRQVREGVSGKGQEILVAIDQLVAEGRLENRGKGKGKGFKLFVKDLEE